MSKFEKYFVIGTGSVALACADTLKGLNLKPTLIESRKSGLSSLRASCDKKGIDYLSLQGGDLKDFLNAIEEPSLIVSAANRYLFPAEVVGKPNLTIINYHGALLPKHPGRNAEAWAIYEGDKEAGITWHFVSSGIDTGAIIDQRSVPITEKTTSMLLLKQNGQLAIASFNDFIGDLLNDNITPRKQTEQYPLHLSSQKPNDGFLDLNWSGEQISSFLRSMDYGPLRIMGYPDVIVEGVKYSVLSYKILAKDNIESPTAKNLVSVFTEDKSRILIQKENIDIEIMLSTDNIQKINELNGGGYLLPDEIESLASQHRIHGYRCGDNAVVLVDNPTHRRVYLNLKEFKTTIALPEEGTYLCEIIFRTIKKPQQEIDYVSSIGFEKTAERTLLQLLYKDVTPYTKKSNFEIRLAKNIVEIEEACQLFNATFDIISGDYITYDQYEGLLSQNNVTVAIDEKGKVVAGFHHDRVKGVAWGRHLAVTEVCRGQSVGSDLLYDFINSYHAVGVDRFMLWSMIDNVAAMRMYDNCGFKSIGRNCISMIKTNKNSLLWNNY